VTNLATPKSGVASTKQESLGGDVLLFTDPAGRLVIAVDAVNDRAQPDGIIDKYYWYRSSRPFTNQFAIRLTNANIVDRGRSLELSSSSHGVRLVLSVDTTPSPDSSDVSKRREALTAQDSLALDRAVAQLTSSSVQRLNTPTRPGVTEYLLTGGFELGRSIPSTPVQLSVDSVRQSRDLSTQSSGPSTIDFGGSCDSGGEGATACSISGCSVSCASGYYACCKIGILSNECKCVKQ
jgi:hypothetical protein